MQHSVSKEKVIYLATNNKNKVVEFQRILGPSYLLKNAQELAVGIDWVEDGKTFFDNALIKAKALQPFLKKNEWILAEDSGLCIDALDGAPGLYSARFMPDAKNQTEKNEHILNLLKDKMDKKERQAHYFCCLVHMDQEGNYEAFEGKCCGFISTVSRGQGGFGYDPIFVPDGYNQSLGELSDEIKSSISHRKAAIQLWRQKFPQDIF